eukprot:15588-Heterococcus_DN1.PRE.7
MALVKSDQQAQSQQQCVRCQEVHRCMCLHDNTLCVESSVNVQITNAMMWFVAAHVLHRNS